jgi:hypothetical protein
MPSKLKGALQPKHRYINPATGNEAGSVIECDTDKLRRFILSILWRASISKGWTAVSLGGHEAKILERIFDATPLSVEEYSIIIHKLDSDALGAFRLAILPPAKIKCEGINAYFFYLPGLRIFIKVDRRNFKATWKPLIVGAKPNCFPLLDDNLKASGELKQIAYLHEQFHFSSDIES